MKTQTVEVVKVEPSDGMYLKNKVTGEVYDGFIYIAKSLSVNDFEEITAEEYGKIIEKRNAEVKSL